MKNPMTTQDPATEVAGDLFAKSAVLIVDDFRGIRTMLSSLVRGCGASHSKIDTAADATEAIKLLSRRHYDVVLCDYNLGPGKNGQQVLEEARIKNLIGPACCWMMVTAEKSPELFMSTAEIQPDAYLIKPITEAILSGRLQKIKGKKNAFIEIDAAMAEKDFLKAIRLCDERTQFDRANAVELLRLKCQVLVMAGEIDKAKAAYEGILAYRDVPWAQLGLAKACHQAGDSRRACDLLEQLVDRNRSYLEAHDYLARVLLALGEKGKAEAILDRALALSPNSHLRQQAFGDVSLQLGKLDNAEKAFRKSVSLAEHSVLKTPEAFLGLAKTVGAKANTAEAMKILGQMTRTFDSKEAAARAKAVEGLVFQMNGDEEHARQATRELSGMLAEAPLKLDSKTTREMAALMLATGENEQAISLLQSEVMNNPENSAVLDSVREIFKEAGLSEQGRTVIEQSRSEAIGLMNEGVLLARNGQYEAAMVPLRHARGKMPKNVRVLLNSAQVLITWMECEGYRPKMANEAHSCLMDAYENAPGEPRFSTLMSALLALN
jgi:tetratricopeptide (TPR) repeat protein